MGGGEYRDARLVRVTICRDARLERPLSNDETYSPLSLSFNAVSFNGDGRTDRASLQRATRLSSVDARSGASILVRQYLLFKDLVLYCSYVHSKG